MADVLQKSWGGLHATRNYCGVYLKDKKNNEIYISISYILSSSNDKLHDTDWEWHVKAEYQGRWLCVERGTAYYDGDKNVMYLVNTENIWGIRLDNFKKTDGNYVNMDGSSGTVLQPWVLAFEPGDATWRAPYGWVKL